MSVIAYLLSKSNRNQQENQPENNQEPTNNRRIPLSSMIFECGILIGAAAVCLAIAIASFSKYF